MFTGHAHAMHPFGHSTAAQVYTDQVELLSLQLTCDTTDVAQSPTISTDNDDMKFVVGAGKDVVAVRAILRPFPGALATRRGSAPVAALRRVHAASCLPCKHAACAAARAADRAGVRVRTGGL